jgi:uncharacterized protein YgiM (DUF1202 family)
LEITQTLQALATSVQATLNAVVPTVMPQPTSTTVPTSTTLPEATLAPTEVPVSPTSTPIVTPIEAPTSAVTGTSAHVNQVTNCRSGPSTDFSIIFTAQAGTDLNIVSRTPYNNYVVVDNPNNSGQTCWLWTQYADINGDLSGLPVAAVPTPPAVLAYTLSFYHIETCTNYSPAFKVVNTGTTTLQSYSISVKDRTTNTTETSNSDSFDKRNGCSDVKSIEYVDPGVTGFIYADSFSYDPNGHDMKATITLCSHNSLGGKCSSQVINFTP